MLEEEFCEKEDPECDDGVESDGTTCFSYKQVGPTLDSPENIRE
jgi:hypothetical protein